MTTLRPKHVAYGIALLGMGSTSSLHAQIEIGNWVRKATASMPEMKMTVEACCGAGRRLTYRVAIVPGTEATVTVESAFDGRDAPVTMDGKPSGETMAIKRVDAHHMTAVLKMNGAQFGTANATLSADGQTLTVINDYVSSFGGQPAGKFTEIWERR